MADPRISHIELDEATIVWRNADVEQSAAWRSST
jgi:hypothetical protein